MTVDQVVRRGPARAARPPTAALVLAAAAGAWATLTVLAIGGATAGGTAGAGHQHQGGAAIVQPWSAAWAATWLLMVAAMMWPLAAPALSTVGRGAYRRWRTRLVAGCLGTVTLLWLAAGFAVASAAYAVGVPAGSTAWQLGWVAVALLLSRSARRARLLWQCARLPAVAPGGARGLRSAAVAGAVEWRRCALLCGPVMTAMAVGHDPVVMVTASLAVWWEAAHPRAWRDPVPVALLTAGAVGLLVTEVVFRV